MQCVPDFMQSTLKIGKIHIKKHFLRSIVGSNIINVNRNTGNVEEMKISYLST